MLIHNFEQDLEVVDVMLIYKALKPEGFILGLQGLGERFFYYYFFKSCKINVFFFCSFLVVGYLKSRKYEPVLSPQLHSAAEAAGIHCKVCSNYLPHSFS